MNPDTAAANAEQDSVETMATLSQDQPKQGAVAIFHTGGMLAQWFRWAEEEVRKNETKGSS